MLNNLEALGKIERTVSGESFNPYVLPSMKIRDFTFLRFQVRFSGIYSLVISGIYPQFSQPVLP
jgi:hypothetical protein